MYIEVFTQMDWDAVRRDSIYVIRGNPLIKLEQHLFANQCTIMLQSWNIG